jgi:hypothetical protein
MKLPPEMEDLSKRLHVLSNRVLVKILPYTHPVLLTPGIEIQKGVVLAVGDGWRKKKLVEFHTSLNTPNVMGPNGKAVKFASATQDRVQYFEDGPETGAVLPMQVKPGDVIEFGFRNVEIVDFDRIPEFYNDQLGTLVFLRQKAIYCIDPDESLDRCLMWQQSAGFDKKGNFMSGAESWQRS